MMSMCIYLFNITEQRITVPILHILKDSVLPYQIMRDAGMANGDQVIFLHRIKLLQMEVWYLIINTYLIIYIFCLI